VKFARRFAVVLLVVAAVTAVGVAWEHSSAAGWLTPPGGRPAPRIRVHGRAASGGIIVLPPGAHPSPGAPPGRVIHLHASAVRLSLSDIGNLTSTAGIVAAVMAGVIALEITRRRVWRASSRPGSSEPTAAHRAGI
jgi:hypothetical protein